MAITVRGNADRGDRISGGEKGRRVRNGVTLNALHRKLAEEAGERDRVAKLKPRKAASD